MYDTESNFANGNADDAPAEQPSRRDNDNGHTTPRVNDRGHDARPSPIDRPRAVPQADGAD